MSGVPYIRFFGDDWLSGTQDLSLEERGALVTIVALIAATGQPPALDYQRLARRFGCTPGKAKKVIAALEALGKISIKGEAISSPVIAAWGERSRKLEKRPWIPVKIQRFVFDRDGSKCRYCRCEEGPFHLDHIVPWSAGGDHSAENLAVACARCNWSKGSKTIEEWRAIQ